MGAVGSESQSWKNQNPKNATDSTDYTDSKEPIFVQNPGRLPPAPICHIHHEADGLKNA
jgi:hypothetical protein